MSEALRLESRIDEVKKFISVMENQINKLSKKIKSEYLLDESDHLEQLHEMKDKAEKGKSKAEFQLNALEEQMVFAIKADAQADMDGKEKELQQLLDKHNDFVMSATNKIYETLNFIKENSVSGMEVKLIFNQAKVLMSTGAYMKKNYPFNSLPSDIFESVALIRDKLVQVQGVRDVEGNVFR